MPDPTGPTARSAALRAELFGPDLSVAEIADVLDLDESTIRRRLGDGTLQGYRLGREWRMTENALRLYVSQLKGDAMAGIGGTARPIMPHDWGTGSIRYTPSVTHPIGATITYSGMGAETEIDEP